MAAKIIGAPGNIGRIEPNTPKSITMSTRLKTSKIFTSFPLPWTLVLFCNVFRYNYKEKTPLGAKAYLNNVSRIMPKNTKNKMGLESLKTNQGFWVVGCR